MGSLGLTACSGPGDDGAGTDGGYCFYDCPDADADATEPQDAEPPPIDCSTPPPVTVGQWQPWAAAADAGLDANNEPSGRGYAGFAMGRVGTAPVALLFGGGSLSAGVLGDAWEFDTTRQAWSESASGPVARGGASLAYAGELADASTPADAFVLFGGQSDTYLGDTWRFTSGGWASVCGSADAGACSCGPCPRAYQAMAYDVARSQAVMFGGRNDSGPLQETWVMANGAASWSQKCVASCDAGGSCCTAPSARSEHALAYDSGRNVVVLFGGLGAGGTYLGDTWEWDGQSWTERFPAHAPAARSGHAMSGNPLGTGVVMFGGANSSGTLREAPWTWDGTDWTSLAIPGGDAPVARSYGAMTTDQANGKLLLFGGGSTGQFEDLWSLSLQIMTPAGNCPVDAGPLLFSNGTDAGNACSTLSACCTAVSNAVERGACQSAVGGADESECQTILSTLQDGGICH